MVRIGRVPVQQPCAPLPVTSRILFFLHPSHANKIARDISFVDAEERLAAGRAGILFYKGQGNLLI
eukprot:929148-Karenia_brevis.AAC.1